MVVRVRFGAGRRVRRKRGTNRDIALGIAAMLSPAVLCAYLLAAWRLAADLRFAGGFGIEQGVFSHWQVWMALGVGLHASAFALNRYGHEPDRTGVTESLPHRSETSSPL